MTADSLLLQIQEAARARDLRKPGSEERLRRLIEKLKNRDLRHLRRPSPVATLSKETQDD